MYCGTPKIISWAEAMANSKKIESVSLAILIQIQKNCYCAICTQPSRVNLDPYSSLKSLYNYLFFYSKPFTILQTFYHAVALHYSWNTMQALVI